MANPCENMQEYFENLRQFCEDVKNHPCFSKCMNYEDFESRRNQIDALFNDKRITDKERLDFKLNLLVACRQYQDDFDEMVEKMRTRMDQIDSNIKEKEISSDESTLTSDSLSAYSGGLSETASIRSDFDAESSDVDPHQSNMFSSFASNIDQQGRRSRSLSSDYSEISNSPPPPTATQKRFRRK